jgi:hypothetical protein
MGKKRKDSKKKAEASVQFDGRVWPNILDFNVNLDAQLTSKANFIFGASTLILVFILNKALSEGFSALSPFVRGAWLILLAGSFFSSLLSMMVVLPKIRIFSKKERVKEDIFYYKNIINFYSRNKYVDYLKNLPTDNARIGKAYANQVYSLATHILPYKFMMLKRAGWILVGAIIASIILLGIGSYYQMLA